jgi:hypothetical protein
MDLARKNFLCLLFAGLCRKTGVRSQKSRRGAWAVRRVQPPLKIIRENAVILLGFAPAAARSPARCCSQLCSGDIVSVTNGGLRRTRAEKQRLPFLIFCTRCSGAREAHLEQRKRLLIVSLHADALAVPESRFKTGASWLVKGVGSGRAAQCGELVLRKHVTRCHRALEAVDSAR